MKWCPSAKGWRMWLGKANLECSERLQWICHSSKFRLCWEDLVGIGCWSRPYCTMRGVPCYDWSAQDATKEHLDRIYTQNEGEHFNHNMERFSWYNRDEISIQCLRALPNKDVIFKNDIYSLKLEAVRCILTSNRVCTTSERTLEWTSTSSFRY